MQCNTEAAGYTNISISRVSVRNSFNVKWKWNLKFLFVFVYLELFCRAWKFDICN